MNTIEEKQNLLKDTSILPNDTFYRLKFGFCNLFYHHSLRSVIASRANNIGLGTSKNLSDSANQVFNDYHIHSMKFSEENTPKKNQVLLQLDGNSSDNYCLKIKYKSNVTNILCELDIPANSGVKKAVPKITDSNETIKRIINNIKNNTSLSRKDDTFIFSLINKSAVNQIVQSTNPILKSMDYYIASTQSKLNNGHIDSTMATHKIEFTKKLRTFVEDPSERNWHNVRDAMKEYPQYAFHGLEHHRQICF